MIPLFPLDQNLLGIDAEYFAYGRNYVVQVRSRLERDKLRFLFARRIEFNKGNGYTIPPRIPLDDIERIEIVKTASAEYGDHAVGGLVNVITRVSKKPIEAKAGLQFGDYTKFYTVINGTRNKLEYFVDLSSYKSKAYQRGAYYDPTAIYTRFAYNFDETSISNLLEKTSGFICCLTTSPNVIAVMT